MRVTEREKREAAKAPGEEEEVGGAPSGAEEKISLAVQVAQVAAQVSAVRRAGDEEAKDELASRLALAQARLRQQADTPEGLALFLDVMQGVLRGKDVSAQADDLPTAYRAVYEQLIEEAQTGGQEGSLTVREVLDEVVHNVILALVRGTFDQRRRMADTLLIMAEESRGRSDLAGLHDLLQAARLLLQGVDPTPIADQLRGPFRARWEEILTAAQSRSQDA
jgi:hypothetical protein